MTKEEQQFTFAVAAMIGLVSRGASPAEVRDTMWQYAEFAMINKPENKDE
jgi:hypothetical protein